MLGYFADAPSLTKNTTEAPFSPESILPIDPQERAAHVEHITKAPTPISPESIAD